MIRLSDREKKLLMLLAGVVAVAVVYFLIVTPLLEFRRSAAEQSKKLSHDLQRLEELYDEFRDLKQKKTRYMSLLSNKNENITTLVEQWSTAAELTRNIAYTRRSQATIQNKFIRVTADVKLEGVPIQKLVRFLYEIENSNVLLKISYLRIYQGLRGADTYDVILKIDSFTMQ